MYMNSYHIINDVLVIVFVLDSKSEKWEIKAT